ncbi:MAG TPA: peroxiredoxin [Gaiellales bacterium]|nr:peroxiredoxin [Gaiellales bacterium]
MSAHDPRILPLDLPVPVDDGAARHLPGIELPVLSLPSTAGPLDLRAAAAGTLVLYVYPRTGRRPGVPPPDGWDATPGARGCTPQSCAFRDHRAELAGLGATVVGMSAQPLADQHEFADREHIPYPLISDPGLRLAAALGLPTFEIAGGRLYRRITLIVRAGRIEHVFYPVFPPDRNAADVVAWLRAESGDSP